MEEIYMDHAATTPIDKAVLEAMYPAFTDVFGNPSSIHSSGRKARKHLDEARRVMASSIAAKEREIIFTSGGTEANNLALIGTARANKSRGNHIITTKLEHQAILHPAAYLEAEGFDVTYLPVYENGEILLEDLVDALTDQTILVSIMFVNNETGIIQPIKVIGDLLKGHQAYFHTDAVQAYGLLDIDVKDIGIDLLTVSSHKINGPKGVGFLYVSSDLVIDSLQLGGDQEHKQRAGTENIVSIIGFKKAVELIGENKAKRSILYGQYKAGFLKALVEEGINYTINGDVEKGIASIVNISFPKTNIAALLTNLDLEGVLASSGSACTAGSTIPSHVLVAMFGEADDRPTNSVRFSFGIYTTTENIKEAAKRVAKVINRLTR